jgi:hypothetical protein
MHRSWRGAKIQIKRTWRHWSRVTDVAVGLAVLAVAFVLTTHHPVATLLAVVSLVVLAFSRLKETATGAERDRTRRWVRIISRSSNAVDPPSDTESTASLAECPDDDDGERTAPVRVGPWNEGLIPQAAPRVGPPNEGPAPVRVGPSSESPSNPRPSSLRPTDPAAAAATQARLASTLGSTTLSPSSS